MEVLIITLRSIAAGRPSIGGLVLLAIIVVGCTQGGATVAPPTSAAASLAAASPAAASPAATTQLMGSGNFHDVDGTATGEAQLLVTPTGEYKVVLESFQIEAIEHTNVILVENSDVTATADIDKSMTLDLGPLKAASGMQDFPVPADMASSVMDGYHTVVIWDTEMAHAIAAAPLG
jgi:Electron transfer DM13